ncbi:MAG: hypothetical protein HGB22_05255 [Chlorobiaceae bacterium]|nr:hypothetical protein [Chlorobiaceae bacterium]
MAPNTSKKPLPQSVWTWILITLLWGTVFFASSTWTLTKAVAMLGQGVFGPTRSEAFGVYELYAPLLLVIALVGMAVKNRLDPGSVKQLSRQKAVKDGSREQIFVSFAGSIATSFLFTILTACAYSLTVPLTGLVVQLGLSVVLVAALLNIAAGLAASLFVGTIFIVARSTGLVKRF